VLRLHEAFLKNGINATLISIKPEINDDHKIIQKGKKPQLTAWLENKFQTFITRNTKKEFGLFSYPILGNNISHLKVVQEADFIYIHWVLGGFLNLTNIEQLAKLGKPILFFMHDMWTITGGCHHSFSCEKYKSGCFNCQMFPEDKIHDLSFRQFHDKLKLYSKYNNFFYISPSKWLYNCTKESALTKEKRVFYIPNILDKSVFKPVEKQIAKQIFNIATNKIVLSFGAISITSPYKGLSFLKKALKILAEEKNCDDYLILIFGSGYKKEIADEIPFKTIFLGHLGDKYSTVLVYNATDVFIASSLADNLPTTILESLSCGTPVVAFNVGGIPDLIKHKENGYLARYKDAEDLAKGIKYCIQNKIKGFTLPDFEPSTILNKHYELFDQLGTRYLPGELSKI
jgi:glycosyltransferase involved in cell wall biosynthesis